MKRRHIEYPHGIPRWFTYLTHLVHSLRCKRIGHEITFWHSCNYCGQYVIAPTDHKEHL